MRSIVGVLFNRLELRGDRAGMGNLISYSKSQSSRNKYVNCHDSHTVQCICLIACHVDSTWCAICRALQVTDTDKAILDIRIARKQLATYRLQVCDGFCSQTCPCLLRLLLHVCPSLGIAQSMILLRHSEQNTDPSAHMGSYVCTDTGSYVCSRRSLPRRVHLQWANSWLQPEEIEQSLR